MCNNSIMYTVPYAPWTVNCFDVYGLLSYDIHKHSSRSQHKSVLTTCTLHIYVSTSLHHWTLIRFHFYIELLSDWLFYITGHGIVCS